MENLIFKGREFYTIEGLENFVNVNSLKQHQIVSITNSSTYTGDGHYHKSSFIYFFTEGLKYDCFYYLPKQQQDIIKSKPVKILRYGEDENEKKEWYSEISSLDEDEYEKKYDEYGKIKKEKYETRQGETFIKTFNDIIYFENNRRKGITQIEKFLFPTQNTQEYDNDYLTLLQNINPYSDLEYIRLSNWKPNPKQ
jgi:hypothetical protein